MSTESVVLEMEEKRRTAMMTGDVATLAFLAHDGLIYTHGSGNVDGKASWLEAMRSGRTRYTAMRWDAVDIRVMGNAAMLTGKAAFDVEINGQPRTLHMRYLNVWSKTADGWKFAAWQATPLAG
jgi:ketosteroid isomerase-like protein